MTIAPASAEFPGEIGRLSPIVGAEVLRFDLDTDKIEIDWARARVTDEEAERSARYVNANLQRRALNARALTRAVLAAVVDAPPLSLTVEAGAHGKPRLAGAGLAALAPAFNISHAGGRLLIALSTRGEVGVDVEMPGEARDTHAIAERQFSDEENAALAGLQGEVLERAFLRLWTFKEACVKATGVGVARGMKEVAASPAALSDLTAQTWSPGAVTIGGVQVEAVDISSTDDIAVVAATRQQPNLTT